jgi:hypothetical protein
MDSITLILSPLHKEHPDGINMTNMPFDTTAHRNEFSAAVLRQGYGTGDKDFDKTQSDTL